MLDQSGGLHKVKSGMQHTLSPPPAGAASSSSLAGVDVRAMNLQVAGMPQAVPSPPTAALLFSGAQQMPQPTAGLYQTLLPDPVSRPVAQFSQGAHGYPPMASYQGFGQGGVFVPPPAHPAHSAQDLFAAGAALRLQPTYQTQHVPTSQVMSQQGLQTQQLLGSQVGRGGGHLGTSYYGGPTQGGYYQASQQQPLASVFGSQSLTAFRNFHPTFKSLDLTAAAGAAGAQPSGQEFCPSPVPPQAGKMPSVTSGSAQQKAMQAHFAAAFGQQQGASAGVRPMHVVQLPSGVVRGPHPSAPAPKYPAPIQRPQQQQAAPAMAPLMQQAPQQRGLPPTSLRSQPHPRQLPTSDQQAKQRAEAVKQAQLFFAQSKPSPTCGGNPAEEGKGPSPPPVHGSNTGATAASAADSKDEDKKPAPAKEAPLEE